MRVPSFEESHAYSGAVPTRVPLRSFVGRGCCNNSLFKKNHTGEVITFPETEEELRPATGLGGERLVRVIRNNEEDYFSVESIYLPEAIDVDGNTVHNPFADQFSHCANDSDIIKMLMGHTIKSIQGTEYEKIVRGNRVQRKIQTFVLLTPPLIKGEAAIEYEEDTVSKRTVNDVYKQFSAHLHNWLKNTNDYVSAYHPAVNGDIYLFRDSSIDVDTDGNVRFVAAIKKDEKYTIIRNAAIEISPLVFLEHFLDGDFHYIAAGTKGVRTISKLKSLFESRAIALAVNRMPLEMEQPYYQFSPIEVSPEEVNDDIGCLACFEIEHLDCIKEASIPARLLEKEYPLVGVKYHTPYSKLENNYCILIAEPSNRYDDHAIAVARWFPMKKADMAADHMDIYDWGYIARSENTELSEFMTNNSCPILIAETTSSGMIKILGGIEQFFSGELKDYVIPHFMFKLFKEA